MPGPPPIDLVDLLDLLPVESSNRSRSTCRSISIPFDPSETHVPNKIYGTTDRCDPIDKACIDIYLDI